MASQPLLCYCNRQLLWLVVPYMRFGGHQGGLGWVFQGTGMWSLWRKKLGWGFCVPGLGYVFSISGVGACHQSVTLNRANAPSPVPGLASSGGCQPRGAQPPICDLKCVTGLHLRGRGGQHFLLLQKEKGPGRHGGATAAGGGGGGQSAQGAGPARSVGGASALSRLFPRLASAPKAPCRSSRFPPPQWEAGRRPAFHPMSAGLGARRGPRLAGGALWRQVRRGYKGGGAGGRRPVSRRAAAMLSARAPLAARQEQLRLPALKGLALSDKENTVSGPFPPSTLPPSLPGPPLTAPLSPQPPAASSSRVLASKAARNIFQEPVSARPDGFFPPQRLRPRSLRAGGAPRGPFPLPQPLPARRRSPGAPSRRSRCCGRTPAASSSSPSSTTTSGRCTRRPRLPSGRRRR